MFAEFFITVFYLHFFNCVWGKKFSWCLHLRSILIRRSLHFRFGFFRASKFGYFLSIVDCSPMKLQLMLKEGKHVKWENLTLNKDLKQAELTHSFWCYSWFSTGLFYFILVSFIIIILIFSAQFVFYLLLLLLFYNFFSFITCAIFCNVSRFLKCYVKSFESWIVSRFNLYAIAGINSTELVNKITT